MVKSSRETKQTVRNEALAWFVRLNSGHATQVDRVEHATWLAADAVNRAEYSKLGGIWSDLDLIADPRKVEAPWIPRRPMASRRRFLVGGAVAVAAAGVGVFASPPDFLTADHFTGTGEVRTVVLADGSTVELDADSSIALDYTDQSRTVSLKRGRAFFTVAKDASRPFTVVAANGRTTALGTRFIVHVWAGLVTVTVEESAVSVVGPTQNDAVVSAGQYVTYDQTQLGDVRKADIESEISWRRGKLIFEDRPLRQVIADVNRYRSGIIRVTDSRLLDMRVSGIFDVRNPDGILDAIIRTLPVRTFQLSCYLVVLYPA